MQSFNIHKLRGTVAVGVLAVSLTSCGGGSSTSSRPDASASAALASTPVADTSDPAANAAGQTPGQALAKLVDTGSLQGSPTVSLQVTNPGLTNRFVRHTGRLGFTEIVSASSPAALKADASWKVVAGLADASCYSFQSVNFPTDFLRHTGSRVVKDANDNSPLFKADATWCAKDGLSGVGVSFESKNYPGHYLRHYAAELWMARRGGPLPTDSANVFEQDVSWNVAPAWSTGGNGSVDLPTSDTPDFGPNVTIFDPSSANIQGKIDGVFKAELLTSTAQFGDRRTVFLFKPGTYSGIFANLGFYTTIAGLGKNPDDVTINGNINVDAGWNLGDEKNATQNFWRSMENLALVPNGGVNRWAVSQAAPMRRIHIRGNLTLAPSNQDFGQGYSSGGYIADSRVDGEVSSGSQQQWYTRDSSIGKWSGGVWNMVFSGVQGAPATAFPNPPHTTLATTPVSREKPYLYIDNSGKYQVFVPSLRVNASGASWPNTPGVSIPMSRFYVARPSDSTATLNAALAQGLNLFFTPGVYRLSQTLNVTRADTVVTGIGFPTLIPENGVNAMTVADVDGVKISNLLFDAGTVNTPVLMTVGTAGSHINHAANPISVQDVFFRIGGAVAGKSTTSLVIHSDHTLIDHIWAWRADHGNFATGWNINTADTGLIVNGNDVLATGLFVEHYQKYEVIWNGQRGKTIFFQNEKPYDVPDQATWRSGQNGYAAYKVGDSVTSHELWGGGSYSFFNVNPSVIASRGFEVPNNPGVRFNNIFTVSLGNVGTISNVINNVGAAVPQPNTNTAPSNVLRFP